MAYAHCPHHCGEWVLFVFVVLLQFKQGNPYLHSSMESSGAMHCSGLTQLTVPIAIYCWVSCAKNLRYCCTGWASKALMPLVKICYAAELSSSGECPLESSSIIQLQGFCPWISHQLSFLVTKLPSWRLFPPALIRNLVWARLLHQANKCHLQIKIYFMLSQFPQGAALKYPSRFIVFPLLHLAVLLLII